MASVSLEDSFIEPTALLWEPQELYGAPYDHYGAFINHLDFQRNDGVFGEVYQHYASFYGIENLPDASTIKAGTSYGYNNALTGSLSISTEQWS